MAAKGDTESAVKAMLEELATYDGTEGKTQADALNYQSSTLAGIIDDHCKALVAKVTSAKVGALGLIAGPYPVTVGPAPLSQDCVISDPIASVPDVDVDVT